MERLGVCPWPAAMGVAVSGGADSMALALLAQAWCRAKGICLQAFTVDHGLRPESMDEARHVASWMGLRGIPCEILSWKGEKPSTRIEERAREARHDLLREACRRHGIGHLLFAHHARDQVETVLMRLSAGSGIDGLAGMAGVSERSGVILLRPLLGVFPERLRATCLSHGQAWLEDPMNACGDFARVRLRKTLPILAREGLTPLRILRLAARSARMAGALEILSGRIWADVACAAPGKVILDFSGLMACPEEIRCRIVERAILHVHSGAPLRRHRLEALVADLGDSVFRKRTLGGCVVSRAHGKLIIVDEKPCHGRARSLKQAAGKSVKMKGAGT